MAAEGAAALVAAQCLGVMAEEVGFIEFEFSGVGVHGAIVSYRAFAGPIENGRLCWSDAFRIFTFPWKTRRGFAFQIQRLRCGDTFRNFTFNTFQI
ncbi:MAG TPA: hypothetical protein DCP91_13115 [Eggerthellaceae bacterium]|nr:hypothetical protein [Eggerthellaceae bacterium]